ncbi:ABC transporter ATP-binding protein [Cellulomonas fimi]|uniref:ABC transporter related protein n=1 Tax=Cellulomonas fimi (strain ATCC 484 / DSM 20113 / JCM 1341 / CCUG 24087 / LMG 16345 / NBRC 15513 / NCIMB 8980 / NCTC 7547 / NRS-133) TaxID=590998 RepID=F4GZ38_CELFA|nr:ABC transporter ATP-binding protein [Cellulomonas fimi]AEE46028.1 ABC transporter related protein [Cellulomonas fimi ATCC 484]NNH06880.1 ABC transporter ATP-binding protein [Cellulomonas fimi]VEH31351.1 Lipoprotein-releasing system ATP-binding protein LolD [Cellulomonas fimi]
MSESTLEALGGNAARPAQYGHDALVVCDNLVRIYQSGSVEVQALQGLDLLVHEGEMVAVVGASGSGKSTLLGVLSGMDAPTAGRVRVGRWDLMAMPARERVTYRRQTVGFVWQQTSRNLLPYLTARQNVALPIASVPRRQRRARAEELLDLVGVGHVADRQPHEMSGGEQQRVAIATALANSPQLLLADEPTGELDTTTTQEVFDTLRTVNREAGTTVVVVTHDHAVSSLVERTVAIRDGRTSSEVLRRESDGDVVHEEYAVMDRAGRLQVPREYREALALTSRVRLVLEADHLAVWRDGGAR